MALNTCLLNDCMINSEFYQHYWTVWRIDSILDFKTLVMLNSSYQYIGGLSLNCLRDYISEQNLTSSDTILLNQLNFDELALEYRNKYDQSIGIPFFSSGVWIKEDEDKRIPIGRIQMIRNDPKRSELDNTYGQYNSCSPEDTYVNEKIFRCGNCGNFVDFNGTELSFETRKFKISIYEKYKNTISLEHVHGECCRDLGNE